MAVEALAIRGAYKAYRDRPVLRNVDLTLEEGSFTSVLGESGSGKTTLLRVIAGFDRVDRGTVSINGILVDDGSKYVTPDKRRIGYVPQEGSLFPHLTVEENVGFGVKRSPTRGKIIEEHLEMVDLAGFAKRYPHELSGGQQQRVAIARALAVNPSLVLMDEPFSALDAHLRSAVRTDVRRMMSAAGATALLVTHDQDEALSLSDGIAMINEGQIGEIVTPRQLYERPATPELARGLGEANFVTGTANGEWVDTPLGALALGGAGFPDGTKLLVLIRPEQITVTVNPTDGPQGVLQDREFYGHDVIFRIEPSWDRSLLLTARFLTSRDAAPVRAPIGATLSLTVHGSVLAWPENN